MTSLDRLTAHPLDAPAHPTGAFHMIRTKELTNGK